MCVCVCVCARTLIKFGEWFSDSQIGSGLFSNWPCVCVCVCCLLRREKQVGDTAVSLTICFLVCVCVCVCVCVSTCLSGMFLLRRWSLKSRFNVVNENGESVDLMRQSQSQTISLAWLLVHT